jgi:hypothetical protein
MNLTGGAPVTQNDVNKVEVGLSGVQAALLQASGPSTEPTAAPKGPSALATIAKIANPFDARGLAVSAIALMAGMPHGAAYAIGAGFAGLSTLASAHGKGAVVHKNKPHMGGPSAFASYGTKGAEAGYQSWADSIAQVGSMVAMAGPQPAPTRGMTPRAPDEPGATADPRATKTLLGIENDYRRLAKNLTDPKLRMNYDTATPDQVAGMSTRTIDGAIHRGGFTLADQGVDTDALSRMTLKPENSIKPKIATPAPGFA